MRILHRLTGLAAAALSGLLLWLPPASAETVVRIPAAGSAADTSHRFFADLLAQVLARTAATDGPARVEITASSPAQERILRDLETGGLDVYWVGTNPTREQRLLAVRVPLTGGMLGLRVPVIRADRVADFDRITGLNDLRGLTACQGDQWPDSDILEANGLTVARINHFRLMYDMLKAGRCDYFPRGLQEVYAEVAGQPPGTVIAYDRLVIAYRYPMYFFTGPNNGALAQRLTAGLTAMAHDGSLRRFWESHPVTQGVFPLTRFNDSRVLLLTNPMLPKETPVQDQALWLPFPGLPPGADFRGNAPLRDGAF